MMASNDIVVSASTSMCLEARTLAADIDRDAKPDFKVELVSELMRLDPALAAEITGQARAHAP